MLSAVRVVRAALPLLRKGAAPSVVLLGAAASRMPYPNQVVSNVHKAGLLGLTKTLAGEYAAEGIRVNCVAPGRTLTRLWQQRAEKLAGVPRTLERRGDTWREWLVACKGGPPAGCDFEWAGPLTDFVLLGNIAIRTRKMLHWDASNGTFSNDPEANKYLQEPSRDGWSLDG